MLRIKLNEQAAKLSDYKFIAYNLENDILCHCSYFLLYNSPETENHWKQELYGFCSRLKRIELKSGDKEKATYMALVEMAHGTDFCEDRREPLALFETIYDSEDVPHDFDYDMADETNRRVYFDAIARFYEEYLVPWIATKSSTMDRQSFYGAIDNYLVSERAKMV